MTIIGIFLIIIGLVAIAIIMCDDEADSTVAFGGFWSALLFIGGIICICVYNEPTAIDVYRGKTTLQITYKNNVPIDTTVVYK